MATRLGIGEFARRCGLSVSALRFYDERGLLKPASADLATGYREYQEGQVATGTLVRDLRRLGLGLSQIEKYLAASITVRRQLLDEHLQVLASRIGDARVIADRLVEEFNQERSIMPAIVVSGKDFMSGVEQVLPALGTDPERPLLGCVLLEAAEGSLRLVATDTYRLAVRDVVPLSGADTSFRAAVFGAQLRSLRKRIVDPGSVVGLSVEDERLVVDLDGGPFYLARVGGWIPHYRQLLVPTTQAHRLETQQRELELGLESMTPGPSSEVLAEGSRDVLGDVGVRFVFEPGRLLLTTDTSSSELEARYGGPRAEFILNRRFALDAVRCMVGPELVIETTGAAKPVVMRSADEGSYIHMMMPAQQE